MTDSPNTMRPASPVASLVAPLMSVSSSRSSCSSKVWSAQSSRRGSDASSVAPTTEDLDTKEKTTEAPAAVTSPTEPAAATATTATAAPVSTAAGHRAPLVHTNDPLRRTYPKPEGSLDLTEALTREPLPWSLGHWIKNARDVQVPQSATLHSEASKKRFQDTKNDLLRSHASLQAPSKKP